MSRLLAVVTDTEGKTATQVLELGRSMIWQADLNSTTPQFNYSGHSGYSVQRSTDPRYVLSGDAGLRLITPTGTKYQRASASKCFPYLPQVGCEVWFQILDDRPAGFESAFDTWVYGQRHAASFAWKRDPAWDIMGWHYWNPAGEWEYIPGGEGVEVSSGWYQWHRLRAYVDYGLQRYVRLEFDDHIFDMRNLSYPMEPHSTLGASTAFALMAWSQTEAGTEVDIGSVKLLEGAG